MAETETNERMVNLDHIKSTLKGKLTRFETFSNSPTKVSNVTQLDIRLKKIESAFNEFEPIQTNLEMLDNSEKNTR